MLLSVVLQTVHLYSWICVAETLQTSSLLKDRMAEAHLRITPATSELVQFPYCYTALFIHEG